MEQPHPGLRHVHGLLANHGEQYAELHRRCREEGPSEELERVALDAATDIALVLLWLWRRIEYLAALRRAALDPTQACTILSELCFGLLLVTSPHKGNRDVAFAPAHLGAMQRMPALTQFVSGQHLEATFVTDVQTELRELRGEGADPGELAARALERLLGEVGQSDEE